MKGVQQAAHPFFNFLYKRSFNVKDTEIYSKIEIITQLGGSLMKDYFSFNQRLGISLPDITVEWEQYSKEVQQDILFHWENIRGSIPDRIADLENEINHKQAQLSDENDFTRSCQLNQEIAELASIINDLWLWYRANQTLSAKAHH
jgi:hypothetical protein